MTPTSLIVARYLVVNDVPRRIPTPTGPVSSVPRASTLIAFVWEQFQMPLSASLAERVRTTLAALEQQ